MSNVLFEKEYLIGSINGGSNAYTFKLKVVLDNQNEDENTSDITTSVEFHYKQNMSQAFWSGYSQPYQSYTTISVGDETSEKQYIGSTYQGSLTYKQTAIYSTKVTHNTDGTLTLNIGYNHVKGSGGSYFGNNAPYSNTQSESVTLPQIIRQSGVSVSPTLIKKSTESLVITLTRAVSTYRDSIEVLVGENVAFSVTKSSDLTFTIPYQTLASVTQSASVSTITTRVTTWNGEQQIGVATEIHTFISTGSMPLSMFHSEDGDGLAIGRRALESNVFKIWYDTYINGSKLDGWISDASGDNFEGYATFNFGLKISWKSMVVSRAISTGWGSLYESSEIDLGQLPVEYMNTPLVFAFCNNNSAFIEGINGVTNTSFGKTYLCRANRVTSASYYTIVLFAIGF